MPAVPPVSVIIPARNAAGTIAATLASLASDRALLAEVILVDDLSADGTAAVAAAAAGKSGLPLRIINSAAGDAGAARNLGLEASIGEWIYFIDADDQHLSGGIAALHGEAIRRPAAGLVAGGYRRRVDGHMRRIKSPSSLSRGAGANAAAYVADAIRSFPMGSVLVSRAAVGATRFPEGMPYDEDTIFWTAVLARAEARAIRRPVMIYHVSTRRGDDRFSAHPVADFLRWRRSLQTLSAEAVPQDALRRRAGVVALKVARVNYACGDYRTAARFLAIARAAPKDASDAWRRLRYAVKVKMAMARSRRSPPHKVAASP